MLPNVGRQLLLMIRLLQVLLSRLLCILSTHAHFAPFNPSFYATEKNFGYWNELVLVGLHSYHPYPANLFLHNLYYVLLKTSGVTLRAGVAQLG
jgi:hypothetical protein